MAELEKVLPDSPYVFPAAQAQYIRNKDKLIRDVKPLFVRAVIVDEHTAKGDSDGKPHRELAEVIDGAVFTDFKRNRLIEVYNRFKAGKRSSDIAAFRNTAISNR